MISELGLVDFRCFKQSQIYFSESVNLFLGDNGSGKSSLIEAIYLLGRGKSFRTNYASDLVHLESNHSLLTLKGSFNSEEPFFLGCSIQNSSLSFKLNSSSVKKRSTLLDHIPLQLFTPLAHQLIDSGPALRRRFLDWGLFHVEQFYRSRYATFTKILKQRNYALKNHSTDINQWTAQYIESSLIIDGFRKQYIEKLKTYFLKVQNDLNITFVCDLNYSTGWPITKSLEESLNDAFSREIAQGFTQYGPHKGDIKFEFPLTARNNLSRGQQKITVFALQLAQCLLLLDSVGIKTLLLIDDLSSELDKYNLNLLLDYIGSQNFQSVVTLIDDHHVSDDIQLNKFHVEQFKKIQS